MTGDISIVSLVREVPGTQWAEARDAAKYPTVQRATPCDNEKASPKCTQYQGRETLIYAQKVIFKKLKTWHYYSRKKSYPQITFY